MCCSINILPKINTLIPVSCQWEIVGQGQKLTPARNKHYELSYNGKRSSFRTWYFDE